MNILRHGKSGAAPTILLLAGVLVFGLNARVAVAQSDKWDPDVPGSFFKDEKTSDKKPKTKHRLAPAPPECPQCQAAVDALQTALNDWYAMQLADAEALKEKWKGTWHSGGQLPDGTPTEAEVNKQKDAAMEGLGHPADGGKAAKQKQTDNAKNKKDTQGTKGKLRDEIKRLTDALKKCLEDCKKPKEEITPTPTPKPIDETTPQTPIKPPPNDCDATIPKLPPCFDNEAARQAYRTALEDLGKMFAACKKNYAEEGSGIPADHPLYKAWQAYKAKIEKGLADIATQNFPGDDGKDAIDKAKVPCPKGGGGGSGKGKTPTPGKPKAPRVRTGHNVSLDGGPTDDFCALISEDKINVEFTGTGETCGHVADCRISNLTGEPISCVIPPMVLESKSGKNQDYACSESETVDVGPKSSKNVPIDGVCLVRNKPPVNKDSGNDLKINNCDGDSRIPDDHAETFLDIATSIFEAADKLLKDGDLKEIPYKDPEKKKDIVIQWATWADPRISEMTGAPPATKEDLKKVVYKQVEENGPMTPETKEKVDEGIDTIFEKIELTTKKAKDLEKPKNEEYTGGNTVNISNDTPTPGPQTKERPKKDKKDKKGKRHRKWPKPIQDWVNAKRAALQAEESRSGWQRMYERGRQRFFEQNKHWQELDDKANEAARKAFLSETKENADNANNARNELKDLEQKLEQDFNKTDSAKELTRGLRAAEKAAEDANTAEREEGKNIDDSTKAIVDAQEDWSEPVPGVW